MTGRTAPLLRVQQHTFDDVPGNVMRLQVFDRAYCAAARLYCNTALDNGAALYIGARLL